MASLTRITPTSRPVRTRKHLSLISGDISGDAPGDLPGGRAVSGASSAAPALRLTGSPASQERPADTTPRGRLVQSAESAENAGDGRGAGADDPGAAAPAPARRRAGGPAGGREAGPRRRAPRPAARPGASRPPRHRRRAASGAGPVRLTRRGKLVVGVGVAGLMAGSFWLGMVSGAGDDAAPQQDAWVVVQSGDTLWTIATRARPGADPHATVQQIIEANNLGGAAVRPGQALRIPGG